MPRTLHTLSWREEKNGVGIDCTLATAKYPGSNTVFLIIPGVDGSLDGHEDKYRRIAESVHQTHGHTVYQMENPFITSHHWESNIRQMLDYIYLDHNVDEIHVMAHSAGAWQIVNLAEEYPEITKLLLMNPATHQLAAYAACLRKTPQIQIVFVLGEKDPSAEYVGYFESIPNDKGVTVHVVAGADHHFSGDALQQFIDAPNRYLYNVV